jgi:hypothetical protein
MMSTLLELAEPSREGGAPAVQEVAAEKEINQELAEQTEPNFNEDPLEEVGLTHPYLR